MPTNRPIRRAQLISPFGVGSLVDFRGDESLMTAGLDEWPFSHDGCPRDWLVREERLQARLGVDHFRLPPDFRDPGPGVQLANQHVPFVRFPRWHYCPMRGMMEEKPLFSSRSRCPCRSGLDCYAMSRRKPWLIPSRFIAACPRGHIEDFPFMDWVHRGSAWDNEHQLRLLPGRSSSSLSGIRLECTCGKSETMAGTFNPDALHSIGYDCSGGMPWLGDVGRAPGHCGEHLRVVQRGASNVYFPLTVSSIYLPLSGENVNRTINRILEDARSWGALTDGLDEGRYIQWSRSQALAALHGIDADELRQAAQRKLDGTLESGESHHPHSEEEFRRQEYEALRNERGGETTDLMVDLRVAADYGPSLAGVVEAIGLVRKLRETRVLVGFSRLLPVEDPTSPTLLPMSQDVGLNWRPASVVYGEGIFIVFREDTLNGWASNPDVINRISSLARRYNARRSERGMRGLEITPKYVLLHTIAHALITQLSFECGYGSSALRERIYCDVTDHELPMQGVLIYTASGDSEGTLGGLVRQGEPDRLNAMLERTISKLQWCSSDPICIESSGQGTDSANLAACHGCILLPETSCETGNRLLDRGLLVGTPASIDIRFFQDNLIASP